MSPAIIVAFWTGMTLGGLFQIWLARQEKK